MELLIYREEYDKVDSIDNFINFYYNLKMNCLTSDLLDKGFVSNTNYKCCLRALKIGEASGIEIRKHFMPVFTEVNKEIISDCKLSQLGYGFVMLSTDDQLPEEGA